MKKYIYVIFSSLEYINLQGVSMKNIAKIALSVALIMGVGATTASADAAKGQKLFLKKLKSPCGFSGTKMAQQHTQDEWEEINDAGKLADEIKKICPKAPSDSIDGKFLPDYYDFFYEFASDSGNVPSC